ncbi:MAG TPA: DUF1573 domain-containing protein [Pirellulales bacterium]|jgi:hypothetical protein
MKLPWFMFGSIAIGLAIGLGSALWQTGFAVTRSELSLGQPPDQPGMPPLPPAKGPQPKVEVDHLRYNFGFMERSAKGTHTFQFKNGGDYPLRLRKGPTSCKCTLSSLEDSDIQPGESADVTLEWRAKGEEPHFRQTATIFTNDPKHRRLELTVDGFLVQSLSLNPPEIVFTGLTREEEMTGKSRLFTSVHEDLQILNHTFSKPETAEFYDVKWSPLPADQLAPGDKGGCEILVTVRPGLPTGPIEQTIRLETNVPNTPPAELRIGGKVGSPVNIVGPPGWNSDQNVLRLGSVRKGEGVKRELKLMIRGPHRNELKLEAPKTDPKELQATLGEPSDLGNVVMIPLAIEIPTGAPIVSRLGTEQGPSAKIRIDTNDPAVGQIVVAVTFAIVD